LLGDHGPAVFAGIRSAFSFLSIICGLEALSYLIYEDPALLHALVDESSRYWTEVGLCAAAAGCEALYVANDMGMNGSTLISPGHLREFFLPMLAQQCDAWYAAGVKVILHSCGNINAILPDLATMHIDALNNLQKRSGMDIRAIKQTYGDIWTLMGNVDATTVMTSADSSDIDRALEELIGDAGFDGALIIATDHSFHQGVPVANVLHFIAAAKRFGSFPAAMGGGGR
jgi:uroporphyrinogen decarboxylase